MLSTVGCKPGHINVYDSLHMDLSSAVKELIANLLQCKAKDITINYCDVQWQVGGKIVVSLQFRLQQLSVMDLNWLP